MRDGDVAGTCASCGSSVRLVEGIPRFLMPSLTDSTECMRIVRRILDGPDVRRGTATRARVRPPVLYFVPYWRINAQVTGVALGVEPVWREQEVPVVSESDNQESWSTTARRTIRTRSGWRAVEKDIRLLTGINISGADLEALGIPSLSDRSQLAIEGMEIQQDVVPEGLVVLDRSDVAAGVLVNPTVHVSTAVAKASTVLQRLSQGVSRGLEQKWARVAVTGTRVSLIYYPLWVMSFDAWGSRYKVVVDGRTGSVLSGRFPGPREDRHIVAAVAGAVWGALVPSIAVSLARMATASPSAPATGCPAVMLAVLVALVAATVKLLAVLDGIERRGNDHVV